MILDNYSTHKHANVIAWLDNDPRFHLHFTPTSSSWRNLVERFFGKLTDKAIRRGVFNSVPDLIAAIETYLTADNDNSTPFVWTATAESILEAPAIAIAPVTSPSSAPPRRPSASAFTSTKHDRHFGQGAKTDIGSLAVRRSHSPRRHHTSVLRHPRN
jgi:hypothetical protein